VLQVPIHKYYALVEFQVVLWKELLRICEQFQELVFGGGLVAGEALRRPVERYESARSNRAKGLRNGAEGPLHCTLLELRTC